MILPMYLAGWATSSSTREELTCGLFTVMTNPSSKKKEKKKGMSPRPQKVSVRNVISGKPQVRTVYLVAF